MASNKEIFKQFLDKLSAEIKANIPSVSGETADSLEVVVDEHEGKLLASKYIKTLEDGRGPTKQGAAKGNPTLRERIQKWIEAKGISLPNISTESLAFIMARKIHREGNRLYRAGGKSGVLSNVLTESRLSAFAETFAGKYHEVVSSEVFGQFNDPGKVKIQIA